MTPAQKGLDTDDRTRSELDNRLVVQLELVTGEGGLQLRLQRRALDGGGAQLRLEHAVAALAAAFDRVHHGIGVGDELFRILALDGDARAGVHMELVAEHRERPVEVLGDARGDAHGLLLVSVLQQHGEFIAAEAGDGVFGPDAEQEALGDPRQHEVAGVVTEAVVDDLEVVQVEEQDRHASAAALLARQRVAHAIDEESPVGQPGEAVVGRLASQLLLEGFALAYVAGIEHDAAHAGIVEKVADTHLGMAP